MQTLPNTIHLSALTPPNPSRPLLIFFPGMDGTGLSIENQLEGLDSAFDIRYLSIPAKDRTSWNGLVQVATALVTQEMKEFRQDPENAHAVYLCGESFGACLALALVIDSPNLFDYLILINPATSFTQQAWSSLSSLLVKHLPKVAYRLSTFGLLPFLTEWSKVSSQNQQALLKAMQSFTPQTVAWRLSLLKKFQIELTSLRRINIPVLLIASAADKLLPSIQETKRLSRWLDDAQVIQLDHSGHACLLERDIKLYEILMSAKAID